MKDAFHEHNIFYQDSNCFFSDSIPVKIKYIGIAECNYEDIVCFESVVNFVTKPVFYDENPRSSYPSDIVTKLVGSRVTEH